MIFCWSCIVLLFSHFSGYFTYFLFVILHFPSIISIFSDIFYYLFNLITSTFFFLVCYMLSDYSYSIFQMYFFVRSFDVSSFFLKTVLIFINSLIYLFGLGLGLVLLTLCNTNTIFHCICSFSVFV